MGDYRLRASLAWAKVRRYVEIPYHPCVGKMRTAIIFAFCLTVSLLGVATMSHQLKQQERDRIAFASEQNRSRLHEFISTLDPEIMRDCVKQFDEGREMALDHLATCGDFDLYARYLGRSKLESVKKFRNALLQSSSRLEFEDRLSL